MIVVVGGVAVVVVVLYRRRGLGGRGRIVNLDRAELSGLAGGDGVAQPRHEDVDSKLRDRGAIHFGELHLEQYFLRSDRTEGQHVDHVLGVGFGDHSGAFRNILGRDVAGEHDGGARR